MRTTPLAIAILVVAIVAILVGRLGSLTWVLIVGFALLALAGAPNPPGPALGDAWAAGSECDPKLPQTGLLGEDRVRPSKTESCYVSSGTPSGRRIGLCPPGLRRSRRHGADS